MASLTKARAARYKFHQHQKKLLAMKYLIFPIALVLFFSSFVFSQTPTSTPDADDQVVRISTSLVQMDVTVTDKDGKPITDLRKDEIEIFQNDKKQEITNFSYVSGGAYKNKKAGATLPASLNVRDIKPEQVRRTIVVVVDDLTLSFESTYWARKAVKKFIETQMQEGDLVAIIRTSAGIGSLQQFTTDKRRLLAAADKIKYNSALASYTLFYPTVTGKNSKSSGDRKPEPESSSFRENIFAAGSLGALNYVLKGMKELPGRKSVMLISEGLPLFLINGNKIPQATGIYSSLKRLVDLANRSSVVIYGIDPVGLSIPGVLPTTFFDSDRRDSLRILSQETGGFAVLNQNDINKGMAKVLNDQSYYLLGYEPDEDTFNSNIPKYNQIKITVSRPDAEVRYRRSFMGFSEENIKTAVPSSKERMINALTSPFGINEITLDLNTLFTADSEKQPVLHSVIHVGPGDLTFSEQPNGKYKASFDLAAMTFGDNGLVVDEMSRAFTVEVDRPEYELVNKNGFVYDFTLALKESGAYQVRVVIRDHVSDKIGSGSQFVDVPNFKKGRLLLSSPFLENLTLENWDKFKAGSPMDPEGVVGVWRATATREFRPGTVLKFAYSVFNARLDESRSAKLSYQPRIFYNGKLMYTGNKMPLPVRESDDYRSLKANGKINLLPTFSPGEYILELTITDEMRKGDKGTADQFIQFEIVE